MDPFVRLDSTAHRREDNRGWLEVVAAMSARRVLRLPPEHD